VERLSFDELFSDLDFYTSMSVKDDYNKIHKQNIPYPIPSPIFIFTGLA
jgi:hypothetical protein